VLNILGMLKPLIPSTDPSGDNLVIAMRRALVWRNRSRLRNPCRHVSVLSTYYFAISQNVWCEL